MMEPKLHDLNPGRILVIQLRQLGDVLLTTPALRALRKRYPGARISFLAEPLPARVLAGNPRLDEVIIRDPRGGPLEPLRTIRTVRDRGFDLVIDFMAGSRSAVISFFSGARLRLSWSGNRRSRFYTVRVEPEGTYEAERKLSLLRPLGIHSRDLRLEMAVPESAKAKMKQWLEREGLGKDRDDPLVCLEPFMKHPALTWPLEHFAKLCEMMKEEWNAEIIVCWGPGRRAEADKLISLCRVSLRLAPETDLHELAALYQEADLWVGVDGGPRHIATSQGLPTFAVMGPSGDQWTPPGPLHFSARKTGLSCMPCDRRTCPESHNLCMKDFSPEEVFELLRGFYERVREIQQEGGRGPREQEAAEER